MAFGILNNSLRIFIDVSEISGVFECRPRPLLSRDSD